MKYYWTNIQVYNFKSLIYFIAKSMDTFCPLGSVLVHKNEIPDPHSLQIKCSINSVMKQSGSTEELIHRVDKLVSFLSK